MQVMDQDTKSVEPCLQPRRLFRHELITRLFFLPVQGLTEDAVGRHGGTFHGSSIGRTLRAIHDLDCLFMDDWICPRLSFGRCSQLVKLDVIDLCSQDKLRNMVAVSEREGPPLDGHGDRLSGLLNLTRQTLIAAVRQCQPWSTGERDVEVMPDGHNARIQG